MPSHHTLPNAPIGPLMGLLEAMRQTPGADELSGLAARLGLELDDLVPLVHAAELLGFAYVEHGSYELTADGQRIADAVERERKAIFREHAARVPLVHAVLQTLEASEEERVPREVVLEATRKGVSRKRAERQLDTAIDWGRYAELFDYDSDAKHFIRTLTNR